MRVYTSSNSAIWLLISLVVVGLLFIVGLGTFLLTTPIGLVLLTFFVIRHYYRKYRLKKAYESGFGQFDPAGQSRSSWTYGTEGSTAPADKTDKYEQRVFSRDQASVAEDVEFKEL